VGNEAVSLGVAQANVLKAESSGRLVQQLLEARLHEELRKGNPPRVSESGVERDWKLLQKALNASDDEVATRTARPLPEGSQTRSGNQP